MANVGINNGRRDQPALSRFVAMLIEEAVDLTGLTEEKVFEKLALPAGKAKHWAYSPGKIDDRAPQSNKIQAVENSVAKLVGRTAHTILVRNNYKAIFSNRRNPDDIEGKPGDRPNLRKYESSGLELCYEDNWPTYHDLISKNDFLSPYPGSSIRDLLHDGTYDKWPPLLRKFSFQWSALWDKELPWLSREMCGVPPDAPVASFLPEMTEGVMRNMKLEKYLPILTCTSDGRKLLSELKDAVRLRLSKSDYILIYEKVISAAKHAEKSFENSQSVYEDFDSTEYCITRQFYPRTGNFKIAQPENIEAFAMRLAKGHCPVHDTLMSAVGHCESNGQYLFVVACPSKDCEIKGTSAKRLFGEISLLPEYSNLLEPIISQADPLDGLSPQEKAGALRNNGKKFAEIGKILRVSEKQARVLFERWQLANGETPIDQRAKELKFGRPRIITKKESFRTKPAGNLPE